MLLVEISKKLPGFTLNVGFSCHKGEVTGLLGASGSGKSMTLRCLAGLEKPDEGRIIIDGQTFFDSAAGINVPPRQRSCGYLFQQYALFPHMTVAQNMAIGLSGYAKKNKLTRSQRQDQVMQMLGRLEMESLATKYPSQLSGGQQQRTALGRMLLGRPQSILLDEPFSALDSFLRRQIEYDLSTAMRDFDGYQFFVSHDRDEIFRMCSQIVVLTKGSVEVSGDRQAIFHQPSTVGVARLTGCQNIASAIPVDEHRVAVPAWGLILNTAKKVAPDVSHVGIRAHFIRPPNEGEAINVFDFSIVQDRQSPFSRSEYLFVKHPAGLGGLANGRHDWLLREQPGYSLETVRQHTCRLCLPPDKILLFGD